ncbi:MAG: Xaa-Pro peptidase family protein, partial [Nitrospinota bacterium]
MARLGLDAFVTLDLKNIRYLTGFTGTSAAVAVIKRSALFFTDFRYASQAAGQVTSAKREITSSLSGGVSKAICGAKAKNIGFEEHKLTAQLLRKMKRTAKGKWIPVSIVEGLRLIKDDAEIVLIEKNFGILKKVIAKVGEIIRPGKRERDIAAELEYLLRLEGAEGPAFDFIVASGKRSALPHGVASSKKIRKGEMVTLDWGAVLDGYNSDNTRNFSVGKPNAKLKKIHDIVLEANKRAIEKVRPGVALKTIDAAARDFIAKNGYGKEFGHGTGHGLGLDVHENPR